MTRSRQGDTPADPADLWTASLAEVDPTIDALLVDEFARQQRQIELVASENFTWRAALSALAVLPTDVVNAADGWPVAE